jgi:hypothetical protein
MDRRERIIEISNLILGLRNQLQILERELDVLIGTAVPQSAVAATGEPKQIVPNLNIHHQPRQEPEKTVADRIIQILEQNRSKDFDAREMLEQLELSDDKIATVRSTLHRLTAENRIARPYAGRFAALQGNPAGNDQPDDDNRPHEVRNAAA